jgi:hypothetical protein
MGKKLFFIVVLVLAFSFYTDQSESKATITGNSSAVAVGEISRMDHKNKPPYRIVNSRYVSRSDVRHTHSQGNNVRIRIKQNGTDNTDIEDFYMGYDSGTQYRMGNVYGIENSSLPLYVKVTYKSWNTFHAVQFDVNYELVIFSPGTWDVTICN